MYELKFKLNEVSIRRVRKALQEAKRRKQTRDVKRIQSILNKMMQIKRQHDSQIGKYNQLVKKYKELGGMQGFLSLQAEIRRNRGKGSTRIEMRVAEAKRKVRQMRQIKRRLGLLEMKLDSMERKFWQLRRQI